MRVSVVIPSYNSAEHILEALTSVRAQRLPVAELIVVDDCSTDSSAALAVSRGATVLSTGRNMGPSAARNIGWRAATGDVIAFLDADDSWEPDHCETLVDLLSRHPDAGLAFSRVRIFGNTEGQSQSAIPADISTWATMTLLRGNIVPQITATVRRTVLDSAGGYDELLRYSEDYDLWLRISRISPFVCSNRVTANYRVHDAQATAARAKLLHGAWAVRAKFLEHAQYTGSSNEVSAITQQLRLAYEDDLRRSWNAGERELLLETLALRPANLDLDRLRAGWMRKIRIFWYPWIAAKALWHHSPRFVQRLRTSSTT